ncbi:hypothetical protein H671_8g19421 [Cricetulus griseus]|uniref:Uncharacterized protein n=1 Tax=Cricetulus griseus TaxID=10029 RepID=A0A061HZD0_CRIGR|nr:hypothetical protein H671_8g19421 [Cricetulus griseus]
MEAGPGLLPVLENPHRCAQQPIFSHSRPGEAEMKRLKTVTGTKPKQGQVLEKDATCTQTLKFLREDSQPQKKKKYWTIPVKWDLEEPNDRK